MPFGLTNTPSTFQGLMNDLFREHLRKFFLLFFYDYLVYSGTIKEHVMHLKTILNVLRREILYLKRSKCIFGASYIECLGHIITKDGVTIDLKKIEAINNWP